MYALPKSIRLRRSAEFRRTLDGGQKVVGPLLVLFLKSRDEASEAGLRLGVIVSRKVGNSVVRSRVKRHLREAYRHLRPEIMLGKALTTMDLVVVARAGAAQADSGQIAAAFEHGLLRLRRNLVRLAVTVPPPSPT